MRESPSSEVSLHGGLVKAADPHLDPHEETSGRKQWKQGRGRVFQFQRKRSKTSGKRYFQNFSTLCNQQVGGSSPSTSSTKLKISYGRVPEWPKGADCKSVVSDFGGPNPPSPTRLSLDAIRVQTLFLCPAFPLAAKVASKTFTPFRLSLDAIRVRALFFCPVVRLAAGAAV